jgi:hypothetical protein
LIFLLEECHPNSIEDISNKIYEEINNEKKKNLINEIFILNVDEAKSEDRLVKEVELAKAQKQTKSYA